MLTRLYVNNFRCLVNFEISLSQLVLLLGPNGSGKSTLFEVLSKAKSFLALSGSVEKMFPSSTYTTWSKEVKQTIELEMKSESGVFVYRLITSYNANVDKYRVDEEILTLDGRNLFAFKLGEVQLYHDDGVAGPTYTYDWNYSALAMVGPRNDNTKLTEFKDWIRTLMIIRLQPKTMTAVSDGESAWLQESGSDFASWYRFLSQEHQDRVFELNQTLKHVLPGFYHFKLEQSGRSRVLKVGFVSEAASKEPCFYDFDALSDGQRCLIVLYTVVLGIRDLGYTVFLDEPDNFLALREIQPWLMTVQDKYEDGFRQFVMISHHPEFIDYIDIESGRWLEREPEGATRIRPLPNRLTEHLRLSEHIARGWTE